MNNSIANETAGATSILQPSTTVPSASLIFVDQGACSLCPNGLSVPDRNRRFIDVPNDAVSCGGFQELLMALETEKDCDAALSVFQTAFDPAIYCHCPNMEPTGVCQLCNDSGMVDVDIDPYIDVDIDIDIAIGMNHGAAYNNQNIVNGVLCSDYVALAAATLTPQFCQSIHEVVGIHEACCRGTGTININSNGTAKINNTVSDRPPN